MTGDTRARMIAGAAQLLATRGVEGTSFSEVLELTQTPRGSLYHHFPGGKNELLLAALDAVGRNTRTQLEALRGESAVVVTERFLQLWRELLDHSKMRAGCAALAVTVAADSPELLEQAALIFSSWQALLAELLTHGGIKQGAAGDFATLLIAACEGGVVLSRAQQRRAPLDVVAASLVAQARYLQNGS